MVSFCAFLGPKTGIDFAHFGLESSMVFEGVTGVHERNFHFNSKSVRKKEKYANSNRLPNRYFPKIDVGCPCGNPEADF